MKHHTNNPEDRASSIADKAEEDKLRETGGDIEAAARVRRETYEQALLEFLSE